METVDVIIPCYNQSRYVSEAVDSVKSQTYPIANIIVVNDGSTDSSADILEGISGIVNIFQSNSGVSAARNRGVDLSRSDLVVFLDADDVLLPHAIALGVKRLKANPQCVMTSGRAITVDECDKKTVGIPKFPVVKSDHYNEMLKGCYISNPACVVFRRKIFENSTRFVSRFDSAEDYHLYLQLTRSYLVDDHDEYVTKYREHSASASRNRIKMLLQVMSIYENEWQYIKDNSEHEAALLAGWESARLIYGIRSASDYLLAKKSGVPLSDEERVIGALRRYYWPGPWTIERLKKHMQKCLTEKGI